VDFFPHPLCALCPGQVDFDKNMGFVRRVLENQSLFWRRMFSHAFHSSRKFSSRRGVWVFGREKVFRLGLRVPVFDPRFWSLLFPCVLTSACSVRFYINVTEDSLTFRGTDCLPPSPHGWHPPRIRVALSLLAHAFVLLPFLSSLSRRPQNDNGRVTRFSGPAEYSPYFLCCRHLTLSP